MHGRSILSLDRSILLVLFSFITITFQINDLEKNAEESWTALIATPKSILCSTSTLCKYNADLMTPPQEGR